MSRSGIDRAAASALTSGAYPQLGGLNPNLVRREDDAAMKGRPGHAGPPLGGGALPPQYEGFGIAGAKGKGVFGGPDPYGVHSWDGKSNWWSEMF